MKKIFCGPWEEDPRPPRKAPGKVPGVTPAGQTSELLRLQSENELLKGKVRLSEEQVAERDAQLVAVRRERLICSSYILTILLCILW